MKCKEQKSINQSRQVSIDLLECIAILLVLVYHSTLYSYDIIYNPSLRHYVRYLFRTLLSPGVPLFFFANGFLLFNKKLNLKKHILKIIHLIMLCGIWGVVRILLLMPIENEFLSPKEIVNALWTWKFGWINSLWFLGALVCIYVIFPVLKVVYDNNRRVFYYFITMCTIFTFGNVLLNEIGTVFLTLVLNKTTTLQGFNFFNMFNPFWGIYGYAFVYFCAGGCFGNIKDKIQHIESWKRNVITIFVMLICCLGLWGMGICYSRVSSQMWDVVWSGYDTLFTFGNVICIFVLCLNLKKDNKIIHIISCNTLGIYFIHELIIHLTRKRIEQYDILCNVPFNILYAIIILVISLLIALMMKKIPLIRRLVS